jgi:histidine ammonia-lyase
VAAKLGAGTGAAYALIRAQVPFLVRDGVMYPHVEAVHRLVAEGAVVERVEAALMNAEKET